MAFLLSSGSSFMYSSGFLAQDCMYLLSWFFFCVQDNKSMNITSSFSDVSDWFREIILSIQWGKNEVWIGLPWGTSLDGFYEYILNHDEVWDGISLEKLRFALVDERCLPTWDNERNDTHVFEKFIQPLLEKNILTKSQFITSGDFVDSSKYEEKTKPFDIAFFGLWPDGHIASLFPHHPWLDDNSCRYISIHHSPKPPEERISLSSEAVKNIPYVCLFAVWDQKKKALQDFLDESISSENCPAKLLTPDILLDHT